MKETDRCFESFGSATVRWQTWMFERVLLAGLPLMVILSAPSVGCSGGDDDDSTADPALENQYSLAGDFYEEILQDVPFSRLDIEVDVMDGAIDDSGEDAFYSALDTLGEMIDMLCFKPGGVNFLPIGTIPSQGDNVELTLDDINALEDQYRETYWHDDTMALYFMYVNGHSDYDDPEAGTAVVGYAYHGSSMVIFMETVNSKPSPARPLLLKTVTLHEFGHQIGLVDNGAEMQVNHSDTEHPPHCDNSECLMYWINGGSSLLANLLKSDIADFDDNCLADIYAAGGKDARGLVQPN